MARETTQTPLRKPHRGQSTNTTTNGVRPGTNHAKLSITSGPLPVSGTPPSRDTLARISTSLTAETPELILRSSSNLSVFSSTESMVSKPTIYMTLPERHHSCVVSHHSISSIPISDDSLDALAIMQCCDNILMAKSPNISSIGFQSSSDARQVFTPVPAVKETRKVLATSEKLARDMEAQMRRRTIKQQQETFFAEARELQKRRAIREWKAKRKQQFPPPPFVPPVAEATELKEANQTDYIFFPSLADEGDLCPAWEFEDFSTAAPSVPEVGSSKQRSPSRPSLPRIKQLRNMAKRLKGSGKQGHFIGGPPKLARQRRPSLPTSKKDLERKVYKTIREAHEPCEERDEATRKGKGRCTEGSEPGQERHKGPRREKARCLEC